MFSEAMLDRQFAICRRLWTAVLAQAVRDVESGTDGEREEALGWIFSRQQVHNGFDAICEWLDLDPERARETLMQRHCFRFRFEQVRGKLIPDGQETSISSTMVEHPTTKNLAQSRVRRRRKPGAVAGETPRSDSRERRKAA